MIFEIALLGAGIVIGLAIPFVVLTMDDIITGLDLVDKLTGIHYRIFGDDPSKTGGGKMSPDEVENAMKKMKNVEDNDMDWDEYCHGEMSPDEVENAMKKMKKKGVRA